MQRSQRGWGNPALNVAITLASARRCGLWVLCVLDGSYPEANSRHFDFLLEGLADVHASLRARGIPLVVRVGRFLDEVPAAAAGAGALVCDEHPEPFGRALRETVGSAAPCLALAVEGDTVIPPALLADHAHVGARTLRPAVHRLLSGFLPPEPEPELKGPGVEPPIPGADFTAAGFLDRELKVPGLADVARFFRGGQSEGRRRLARFLADDLATYAEVHHRADLDVSSRLGAYLHFGHLGPAEVARAALEGGGGPGTEAFLEQVIVRRELAVNAARFLPGYGSPAMVPAWAQRTLDEHAPSGPQEVTEAMMESSATPDPAWNAAMTELRVRGFLHNYLRMYWGKQVLLWSADWRRAFSILLRWNNRYLLDGRDPNGTTGVAWVFGLHDRPFTRRPVFGAVRSMTPGGLARKMDVAAYLRRVAALGGS